jgi:hypothetical protein
MAGVEVGHALPFIAILAAELGGAHLVQKSDTDAGALPLRQDHQPARSHRIADLKPGRDKTDRKTRDGKSLELNFGTIGFRLPKAAIKLVLGVENIIERLRAKKMHTCIRTVEQVDKEALANYDDEVLLDVGCARTKPKDKFWYEVKREEVKG